VDSFFDSLKNMGAGRLAVMALTLFGLVVFFIFIMARSGTPNMTLLYTGLSTADSSEMAAKLDNTRVNYRLSEDGTQISVPNKDVGRARMLLAQEGLPRQGSMGYELFDQKQSFGETSFRQNINQLRALEGELSRTVGTLAQIRSARVHLVLPQRELFSRDTRPASASVFVSLRGNEGLGNEQIQSIQHLIAAAVPQLKASHVAIIDQSGNLLARGEDADATGATARSSEDMRQKYEQRVTRSVEDLVGRVVGFGRVRANVTAELNFDVVSRNSETYNPDGQVVRSTQSVTDESQDTSASASGAPVTVETNLPGLPGGAGGAAQAGSRNNRTEEVTNFEISKTVESVVRAAGEVKRLSIAVVVDGRYETDASVTKPEDAPKEWTAPKIYVPRSDEELDKIATLVKSAVGFDAGRGDAVEVLNMPFAETDFFDGPLKDDSILGFPRAELLSLAETLALSLVAVLAILAVFRPLISHFASAAKTATSSAGHGADGMPPLLSSQGAQAQLTGPQGMLPGMAAAGMAGGELDSMIDMTSVEGKVKASSVQKISELVTNHPNETVSVIRQWMSQES
jgi:flagellar M-ring protein FliF